MSQAVTDTFEGPRPLILQSLQIPASVRVAVLAPHPDDFDAIGITLRILHENGNRIELAVLTSGASGVEDGFGRAFTTSAKARLREDEQKASCRFFGLPPGQLTFLRLAEDEAGHPVLNASNLGHVRAFLHTSRPELVFLPHGNDTNLGHRRVYAFFRQITQEERISAVACLNRDPKTVAMRPDLYTVFGTEGADWKGQLLRFHQSQHQRNLNTRGHGFDERILRMNRSSAAELTGKWPYAEVFEVELTG